MDKVKLQLIAAVVKLSLLSLVIVIFNGLSTSDKAYKFIFKINIRSEDRLCNTFKEKTARNVSQIFTAVNFDR